MSASKAAMGCAGALVGVLALCCGGLVTLIGGGGGGGGGGSWCSSFSPDAEAVSDEWESSQVGHAAAIVQAGIDADVPPRGWTIALATAMQESNLRMYANETVPDSLDLPHEAVGSDHDSVGLFQQRYPMWGTLEELMDARTSAMKFYDSLLEVAGWQDMPLAEAAQSVQGSAYPDAYAKWETSALDLAETLTGAGSADLAALGCDSAAAASADGAEVPTGAWVVPVDARLWSGFRTSERPGHDGVDFSGDDAPRGTPILAAATGIVRYSECNSPTCSVDGSPEMSGCGWMTVIDHGLAEDPHGAYPGMSTRYCHMDSEPLVQAGDRVWAGQVIGVVGNTGSSSAVHLHWEVHENAGTDGRGRLTGSTAIDPVAWMSTMDISLS